MSLQCFRHHLLSITFPAERRAGPEQDSTAVTINCATSAPSEHVEDPLHCHFVYLVTKEFQTEMDELDRGGKRLA
jgi:hypothetical protein